MNSLPDLPTIYERPFMGSFMESFTGACVGSFMGSFMESFTGNVLEAPASPKGPRRRLLGIASNCNWLQLIAVNGHLINI